MINYTEIIANISKIQKANLIRGISVAVVNKDDVMFSKCFGYADYKKKRLVNDNTGFLIGSNTKILTAIAIMQLVDKGILDLDSDIKKYIPDFSIKSRFSYDKITIRNILNHRSGIPSDDYELMLFNDKRKFSDVINYLKDQYLCAPPGAMFAYSNIGYTILGVIVERVTKCEYAQYIYDNIFQPLEIKGRIIYKRLDYEKYQDEITLSYNRNGKEVEEPLTTMLPAGTNTYMSAVDLAKIIQVLLNRGKYKGKQILSDNSISRLLKVPNFGVDCYGAENTGLCLRFGIYSFPNTGTIVSHGGDTVYQHSSFMFIPEEGFGIVVLTNSSRGQSQKDSIALSIIKEVLKDRKIDLTKKEIPHSTTVKLKVEDYVGMYPGYGVMFKVYLRDLLTLNIQGANATMLLKDDGWFSLKPIGISKLPMIANQIKNIEIKIENGLLVYKNKNLNEQIDIGTIATFAKPAKQKTAWDEAIGRYKVSKDRRNFFMNNILIYKKDNYFFVKAKGQMGKLLFAIDPINDKEAMILGFGTSTCETVFLENDKFVYSGLIFNKSNLTLAQKIEKKKENKKPKVKKVSRKNKLKMFDIDE